MNDDKNLDLQKVLEQGTKKMDLTDLQQQGFSSVRVLDDKMVEDLVKQAVDRLASTQTEEQKARILAESRKELDKLMNEHRAVRGRAQLLEADKNELIQQVESLQRELELKSDLEEETLHRKLGEATASLQKQVEEAKHRAQASIKEVWEERKRTEEMAKALGAEQSRLREAEHARTELVEQVLKLQQEGGEASRLRKDLEAVRGSLAKAEELVRDGAKENAALKARTAQLESSLAEASARAGAGQGELAALKEELTRSEVREREKQAELDRAGAERAKQEAEVARLRRELEQAQAEKNTLETALREEQAKTKAAQEKGSAVADRLETERAKLQTELNQARSAAAAQEAALREEQAKTQAGVQGAAAVLEQLEAAEARLIEVQGSLAAETARSRVQLDEALAREAELRKQLAEAGRVQEERDRLRQELAAAESLRSDLDKVREAAEAARNEGAQLRAELARKEKEQEAAREQAIIVSSEIDEIEEKRHSEQQELEALRQVSQSLEGQLAAARTDQTRAHAEIDSLQEILQREQDLAREARNETAGLQARIQELLASSARIEEQGRGLSDENARLKEQLQSAELSTSATSALDHRLAAVERLMDQARQQVATARASAADSKTAAAEVRKTLLLQNRPKRKPGSRVQGGVALDGHALLQEFFRRIRLKERLQKHVPVREKDGQRHPSELLVDVVSALIAGDRRADKEKKGARLEILGQSRGPEIGDLRQFLGRVSPQAGHAVSQVHASLRHNLFSMPEKPARLVLDVGSVDLPRSYRPMVAYEPESKEFWHGELRTTSDKESQGVVPFLKQCFSKVPGGFPRSRVRFRLDPRYFSEDVIRFLNGRGCSYVMEAPDLSSIRTAAKKAKYRGLSGGWEAGEFTQRIHPIRKTTGRFVALRHRLSRKGHPEKPMFRDQTWEYCVYVVDSKISPWRAHQAYAARPSSQAESAAMLSDFTRSKLLGRRRKSHGALFPLYLLASDLVQWFRRKALPVDERGRDLQNLRTELLRLPTPDQRMGPTRLPVLSKRDKGRKSFERVSRKIRRLRPVRPFKFRK